MLENCCKLIIGQRPQAALKSQSFPSRDWEVKLQIKGGMEVRREGQKVRIFELLVVNMYPPQWNVFLQILWFVINQSAALHHSWPRSLQNHSFIAFQHNSMHTIRHGMWHHNSMHTIRHDLRHHTLHQINFNSMDQSSPPPALPTALLIVAYPCGGAPPPLCDSCEWKLLI